jgi:hypothetical protein
MFEAVEIVELKQGVTAIIERGSLDDGSTAPLSTSGEVDLGAYLALACELVSVHFARHFVWIAGSGSLTPRSSKS